MCAAAMVSFSGVLLAQDGGCGTVITPEFAEQIRQNIETLNLQKSERTPYHYAIPVAMHIVRKTDGTGGFNPADMAPSIDSANNLFAQANVSIFLFQPTDFVDNDFLYGDQSNNANRDSLRHCAVVPEAVNIYFVPSSSGFGLCGQSSFPMSGDQGIIMSNDCAGPSLNNTVLVHEIGHYFNLLHTHEPFYGIECPNGSNCGTAGDLLCDTPADPNVYTHVTSAPACVYDNFAGPPAGCDATPYDPPIFNIMSYSAKSCSRELTTGQDDRFRSAAEILRPELSIGILGVLTVPNRIVGVQVPAGTIGDTTISVRYVDPGTATILSASSTTGLVAVSAPLPINLATNGSVAVSLTFDATALTDPCDLGEYLDTIVIIVGPPKNLTFKVPVSFTVGYGLVAQNRFIFGPGPGCLRFTVPPTPAIGNQSDSGFYDSFGNTLYDASFLIGLRDGADTVVYQDLFKQSDFSTIDSYSPGTDDFGRTTQSLRWITKDRRLQGDITYHFGANTLGVDSCLGIAVDYVVRNLCDTALTIIPGIFGDFDIVESGNNDAVIDPVADIVAVRSISFDRSEGFAAIRNCSGTTSLRAISNATTIYPTNGLPDGLGYQELAAGVNSANLFGEDVSALLSLGPTTLAPGGSAVYTIVIIKSTVSGLPAAMASLRLMRPACEFEVPAQFATIQEAINAAGQGDKVVLAPGTYSGIGNRDINLTSKKVGIVGAAGAAATIIDVGGTVGSPHRAFQFGTGQDSTVIVRGVTIQNGYGPFDGISGRSVGGAVKVIGSASPKFVDCIFRSNRAEDSGGGVLLQGSGANSSFTNCQFISNVAETEWGGGLSLSPSTSAKLYDCVFLTNSANLGGGLSIDNSATCEARRCLFKSNTGVSGGGGINIDAANPLVEDCTFDQNYGVLAGGAITVNQSLPTFVNCTFIRNQTQNGTGLGSVFYGAGTGTTTLQNCILAYNKGAAVTQCVAPASVTATCTDVFGNPAGDWTGCLAGQQAANNNLSVNPQICDTTNGDYRVSSQSSCAPSHNACNVLIGAGSASCGNTPAGSAVLVDVTDSLQVTFATVVVDGETSVSTSTSGPAPPAGFQIIPSSPNRYYNISTTAPHSGTIEICISYDSSEIVGGDESGVALFHHNGSAWVNITTSLDLPNNIVCGQTSTLSPFVVAYPSYLCGDANGNGTRNISDAVYLINYIFAGGPAPSPVIAGDANCSNAVSISDVVYLINYIFSGGAAPCAACP